MIPVLTALAYGVAAGCLLPLAPFALGLMAGVVATVVIGYAESSAWALAGQALAVIVFGQIGYSTAVFARAAMIDAGRAKVDGRGDAVPDMTKKLQVPAED